MKKIIPNILTLSRIFFIPFIVYFGIKRKFLILLLLTALVAFTDYLDGYFARRFQVESEFGAKLDAVCDKLLALSLLLLLFFFHHFFIYIFILETLIASFNLYTFYKTHIVQSLLIGKIKTWFIFITILLGYIDILWPKVIPIRLFIFLTLLLQFCSLIEYIENYKNNSKKKEKKLNKEYLEIVRPILENEEFLKRKSFPHHYKESVYDHVLRVSYDCYKIGKKWHLDYRALAIAGLLHDFYEKPWQTDFEKRPFFQKHGFTHAENARCNALKYFPEFMNEKIASMIKTHMFPLNKKLPKYKESWILTLVDKADSIDFLFHPLMLSQAVRKGIEKKQKKCSK